MSLGYLGLVYIEELVQPQEPLVNCSIGVEYECKSTHLKGVFTPEIVVSRQTVVKY